MIPKQIIQQAISKGWDGEWDNVLGPVKHMGHENAVGWEIVSLDPSFWFSLIGAVHTSSDGRRWPKTWLEEAQSFYGLILTGQNTDYFWKQVLERSTARTDV